MTASDPPLTIRNSRHLPYPAHAVFAAYADPLLLARWWGPKGFRNEIDRFAFEPGGDWHTRMIAPDGQVFANESRFLQIERPTLIVFEHLGPMHDYRMTIRIDAQGDAACRHSWEMCFRDPDPDGRLGPFLYSANEQNFDRLTTVLADTTARPGDAS